jgi:hypothetical protein
LNPPAGRRLPASFDRPAIAGLEGKYLWTTNLTLDNLETDINLNGIQATLNLGFLF